MTSGRQAWAPGYTQAELDDAQARFALRFPPDLVALLLEHRIPGGWDWTRDEDRIRDMLNWPLEGILFDVENAGLWWPEWGERPPSREERAEIVGRIVAAAPRLIPLYGHRFIPEEPHEAGNPVFSVHQSDIIHYGSDLDNYLENEFAVPRHSCVGPDIRRIRFWSEAVERA